jgi:Toprim domain
MPGAVLGARPAQARHRLARHLPPTVFDVLAAATRLQHRGTPMRPAWAAGSNGGLVKLPVIPGVERLIILVDHDLNGAGQMAAMRCTERWTRAGHSVVRLMPKRLGADFNDLVMELAS